MGRPFYVVVVPDDRNCVLKHTKETNMPKKLQHHHVANQLRDLAVLIDPGRIPELTVASDQQNVPSFGFGEHAASLADRADCLEKGKFRLAVVGSVGSGKSTLINALLGGEVLPVSLSGATGMITQIGFGEKRGVTLVEKSGGIGIIPRETFIKEAVLDSRTRELPKQFAGIDYAVLESDAFLCQKGICIVDTPGFNSEPKLEAITRNCLKQVDAILLVISGLAPFTDNDLAFINFLKRIDDPKLDHVFFVINVRGLDEGRKIEFIDAARGPLADEFNADQFEHHVCVVDAKAGLEAKCDGSKPDVLKTTGLPALEHRLTQYLEEDRRVSLITDAAVCDVLIPILTNIRSRVETQDELLTQSGGISEVGQPDAESQLLIFEQEATLIQNILDNFAKEIGDTVGDNAISYLIELVNPSNPKWKALAIEPGVPEFTGIHLSTEKRDEFVQKIIDQLTVYFQKNMSESQHAIFKDVEQKIEVMSKALDEKTAALFRETLEQIRQIKMDQVLGDILPVTSDVIGKFIRPEVLMTGLVVAFGAVLLGVSFFSMNLPVRVLFIVVMLLGDAIYLCIHGSKTLMKIRVSEELKKSLEERTGALKLAIHQSVSGEFERVLETHIARGQREQSDIAAVEKNPLKALNALFTTKFEEICQTAYERRLTHEEIQRFCAGRR